MPIFTRKNLMTFGMACFATCSSTAQSYNWTGNQLRLIRLANSDCNITVDRA
jgi:hypothetical protein